MDTTLEDAKHRFEIWRRHKQSIREPIPEELRKKQICKTKS